MKFAKATSPSLGLTGMIWISDTFCSIVNTYLSVLIIYYGILYKKGLRGVADRDG